MRTIALFCLLAWPCSPQERTGALLGRVLDETGGALVGARVSVRNLDTNARRPAVAVAETGDFHFPLLPVGVYSITAEHDGFQTLVREGVRVGVSQQVRVDLTLAVAGAGQSVTVVEDAPQVNTASAAGGVTVGERQIAELPLNGRNFTQLGTLLPGAVPPPARWATQTGAGNNGFSINGQRTQSNNFLLDGVTNNDLIFSGYVVTPPPDALDQFKILTSLYSAEYGNNSGSAVNVVTKAGTNAFHGRAWNFLRNDALDAREFFSVEKPPLRQNQYGVTAGGRLVEDRTFYFGYYEGLRARVGTVQNVVVLTDAQRQGNLAGLTPPPRDPLTGQPFPTGVIPASRIDPIAARLLERLAPRVNFGANGFNRAPTVAADGEQAGGRLDHRFSDSSSFFARYAYARNEMRDPIGGASFSPAGSDSIDRNHSAVVSHTLALSPLKLNEASVSFLRQFGRPSTWSGEDLAAYGWRYPATEPTAKGLPVVTLSGLFSMGDVAQSWTRLARNTYQAYDNFSWVRGRHTLKMGGDYRLQQIYLVFPNRPNGDFSLTGAVSGNVISDFLLGRPAQFRQGGGQPAKHFVGHGAGLFLQDDWKATRRLTLNLGVRWEPALPYYDKQDRVASFQPGRKSQARPGAPPGLLFPGDAGVPRATIPNDWNNLAPRIGFAYDLTGNGRTSLRGGYGVFHDTVPGVAAFQNINVPPFNRFIQIDIPPEFANPYRNFALNPQSDPGRDFPCPCLVIGFSPDFRTPYGQQMHVTVSRQLTSGLMAEAGYVGSLGRKLAGYLEVNPAVPGPGATRANTQARRIHPDYNLVRPTFSRFNSSYHSLQARVEKRYSRGLAFTASYTWSKAIDYQSSLNFSGENRPQDAFSLSDVRGLAAFDTRHRFVASYSYELPWLRGRRGAAAVALGGWQLLGIVAAQSGNPLTVNEPVDVSLRGLGADRPDQLSDPNSGPKTPQEWFSRSAFARLGDAPGGQRSGTAGRNTVTGPGFLQTDLSAIKRFALTERLGLEYRAEFFNALNRANFLNPNTNIGQPATFGVIQRARPGRIVQMGLKLGW